MHQTNKKVISYNSSNIDNFIKVSPKMKVGLFSNVKAILKTPRQLFILKKFKRETRRGNYIKVPFEIRLLAATGARTLLERIPLLYIININLSKYEKYFNRISEIEEQVAVKILGESANKFLGSTPDAEHLSPWDSNIQITKKKAFLPELGNWEGYAKKNISNTIVDIVIPVYGQRKETLSCIHSVLNSVNKTEYEIVVIDDCGNDDELSRDLIELSEMSLITLQKNKTNLGFVKSVNIGMSIHQDRDVILLNSDTNVYSDWIDRIIKHTNDDLVATVTPLSNSATICSYPYFCKDYDYNYDITDEKLDNLASSINQDGVEVPTGVGFCMFIKRKCLQSIGNFNAELFGRGYGEENDFCQRASSQGWKNIAVGNVFVRHYGGTSFGKEKADLCQKAQITINEIYPNYTRDVEEFINKDPMATFRENLDLQRFGHYIAQHEKRALLITLNLIGGTERHVNELASSLLKEKIYPIILKCSEGKLHFDHELIAIFPNLKSIDLQDPSKKLHEIFKMLSVDFVHIHHLLGIQHESIDLLAKYFKQIQIPYFVTIHDYFPICPRINLIDKTGIYCGEPSVDICESCVKDSGSHVIIKSVNEWRNSWKTLLEQAKGVFVPNIDVSERLQRYFGEVNFSIRPHDIQVIERKKNIKCEIKRIAIIGGIGAHKGSNLLHSLAVHAKKKHSNVKFIVMGKTDIDSKFRSLNNVIITGSYEEKDGLDMLKSLNCDAALFLSLCPETFSYTLSLTLQASVYPIAFDLGALGQRIRELGIGTLLDPTLMQNSEALFHTLLGINKIADFKIENHTGYLSYQDYYQSC